MLKNFIALILFSLGVIFGAKHIQPIIFLLVSSRDWISQLLLQVFSGGEWGSAVRNLISLLVMPLFIAAIPALVYWLSKRRFFPYFMHVVWVVWLVEVTTIIVRYVATGA
jgi:hypothetical protein